MNSWDVMGFDMPAICMVLHVSKQAHPFCSVDLYEIPRERQVKRKRSWREQDPEPPIEQKKVEKKEVVGIFVNGVFGGGAFPYLQGLQVGDDKTLLQFIEECVEESRSMLLAARSMEEGYPCGSVWGFLDCMGKGRTSMELVPEVESAPEQEVESEVKLLPEFELGPDSEETPEVGDASGLAKAPKVSSEGAMETD